VSQVFNTDLKKAYIRVGDHLMPHLSVVLDHTVWLAETIPSAMRYVPLSHLS
jgi:hypothetical protein